MIYLTSDLHLFHDREFLYLPRGFKSIHEMNEEIVKNWNNTVNVDDDIYVLGDLMLNDNQAALEVIKSLKGNIHVVYGNHDTDARIDLYNNCDNIVETSYAIRLKYKKYRFYLTHFPTLTAPPLNKLQKPLKENLINLCGHSHTKDKFCDIEQGLIYHVELDAHENKLVPIEKIIEDLSSLSKTIK